LSGIENRALSQFWCNVGGMPKAAKRFFRKVLKGQGEAPRRLLSDKLGSYRAAARELLPETPHDTSRYANNRVELSHQPTRQQERQMRRFKSRHQAQRFLSLHARVNNLCRYGRQSAPRRQPSVVPGESVHSVAAGHVRLKHGDRITPLSLLRPATVMLTVPGVGSH